MIMIDFGGLFCYYHIMIFEKRLDIIMKMLEDDEKVSNKKLLETLGISESTLRRDLDYLEQAGNIRRVYGGAVLNRLEDEKNLSFNETENIAAKKIIGKKASEMIEDGNHIFLDAGTTTHQLIVYLPGKKITVVTNGLMHLEKLSRLNIPTMVLGGNLKASTFITYGETATRDLMRMNFDLAFIGANGINDKFYSTADIHEATIKKIAIENSHRAYVLADSSKIGKRYFLDFATRDEAMLIKED